MTYNLTNVTSALTVYDQVKQLNDLSNGLIASLILVSLGLIMLVILLQTTIPKNALLGTTAFIFGISILFWTMELIGLHIVASCMILFFIMLFIKLFVSD